jgi:hypothetical protein
VIRLRQVGVRLSSSNSVNKSALAPELHIQRHLLDRVNAKAMKTKQSITIKQGAA